MYRILVWAALLVFPSMVGAQTTPLKATVYYQIQYAGNIQASESGNAKETGIDSSFFLLMEYPAKDSNCVELFFVWRGAQKWSAFLRKKALPQMSVFDNRGQVIQTIKPKNVGSLFNYFELQKQSSTAVPGNTWVAECMYKGKKVRVSAGLPSALPKIFRP